MAIAPIAFVDAGVDYITCSFNSEARHELLRLQLDRTRRVLKREGHPVSNWRWNSYVGEHCGELEWGERGDGALVRLSGFSAQRYWRRFGKLATNCSRLDLQVTCVYDEPWSKTTARHWREMRRWWKENPHRPKPMEMGGPIGIESVYSGQRVSDVFLRCYHRGSKKGCEAAMGHIRYEAELKNVRAGIALASLLEEKSIDNTCRDKCHTMFVARGCCLSWRGAQFSRIRAPTKRSEIARRLQWLRAGVRPSVQDLITLGYGAEVLEALGLCEK